MTPSLLFIAALLCTEPATEMHTGIHFASTYETERATLVITGTDRRRVMGRNAYAVAHYASARTVRNASLLEPGDRLQFYIDSRDEKTIVFQGVYRKVPARGIRWSWQKHFERIGEAPHEGFIQAFTKPFRRGEQYHFIASDSGKLEVRHNDMLIGGWEEPSLVTHLWAMCLGPETEIVNPTNLVSPPSTGGVQDEIPGEITP